MLEPLPPSVTRELLRPGDEPRRASDESRRIGEDPRRINEEPPRRTVDEPQQRPASEAELRLRRENEIRSLAPGETPEKLLPKTQVRETFYIYHQSFARIFKMSLVKKQLALNFSLVTDHKKQRY